MTPPRLEHRATRNCPAPGKEKLDIRKILAISKDLVKLTAAYYKGKQPVQLLWLKKLYKLTKNYVNFSTITVLVTLVSPIFERRL